MAAAAPVGEAHVEANVFQLIETFTEGSADEQVASLSNKASAARKSANLARRHAAAAEAKAASAEAKAASAEAKAASAEVKAAAAKAKAASANNDAASAEAKAASAEAKAASAAAHVVRLEADLNDTKQDSARLEKRIVDQETAHQAAIDRIADQMQAIRSEQQTSVQEAITQALAKRDAEHEAKSRDSHVKAAGMYDAATRIQHVRVAQWLSDLIKHAAVVIFESEAAVPGFDEHNEFWSVDQHGFLDALRGTESLADRATLLASLAEWERLVLAMDRVRNMRNEIAHETAKEMPDELLETIFRDAKTVTSEVTLREIVVRINSNLASLKQNRFTTDLTH